MAPTKCHVTGTSPRGVDFRNCFLEIVLADVGDSEHASFAHHARGLGLRHADQRDRGRVAAAPFAHARPLEGLPEAALGGIAVVVGDMGQRRAAPEGSQGEPHAPGPLIGLECHVVALFEGPAHMAGIDAERAKVVVGDGGASVHLVVQATDPRRAQAVVGRRTASPAGPVASADRVRRPREVLHVLRAGLARRAGGPAEDAGGLHAEVEDALETGVLGDHSVIHHGFGWQHVHGQVIPRSRYPIHRKPRAETESTPIPCHEHR